MPHFIIECNKDTTKFVDEMQLVKNVYDSALNSGLFSRDNIKARLKVYDVSLVAGEDHDFIHVWGYIREGRTEEQKNRLSEDIVSTLKTLYPDAYLVSCDIRELDEASYIKIQL
jgi:5-carboxymethyl-2-hydroxymuconate isomerase